MTIREQIELREVQNFAPFASLSKDSKGRDIDEEPCDIRPAYQRDRDRILHSKAFRRLKHKTQVFLAPRGDHYRTRLTHTLEVSQIARTIAKALRLNEDLTEAIALSHDIGHSPFGHAGEWALNKVCPDGFSHYEQSIRVVEILEKKGRGLNLTWEVRDGIVNHRTSGTPHTLEGKIVRLSDKIAYINHDIDDAQRAGILLEEEIPIEYREVLGYTIRERLNILIQDIIKNSYEKDDIIMSVHIENAMLALREFMFENVYYNQSAKGEERKAKKMLIMLYEYYSQNLDQLPIEYLDMTLQKGEKEGRVICDYLSGMTDQFAISKFQEIYVPNSWKTL